MSLTPQQSEALTGCLQDIGAALRALEDALQELTMQLIALDPAAAAEVAKQTAALVARIGRLGN